MRLKALFEAIVSTGKIIVDNVEFDDENDKIYVDAHPYKKERCRCGICHRKCKGYDQGEGIRLWRCNDIGATRTYVRAAAPRVYCKQHGVVTAAVPWGRHKSRYTKAFEETLVWLTLHTSKSVVAEYLRVDWHSVGMICDRVYKELDINPTKRFDNLVNIGIDETSYTKGHNYITVILNHDNGKVIWCHKGFGSDVLDLFFKALTPEQRASIRCVTADGAGWIRSSVERYCPNAERCIDPFHVVQWATDALDEVRRQAWSEAHREAKKAKDSKVKDAAEKQKKATDLKGTRYALLKNPENTSDKQKAQLEFLAQANPILYRAYLLKENLRLALKAGPDEIEGLLKKWMSWAQRCRITVFRDLRKKIKKNLTAIIATARYGLSNARVEATNNKIKLIIRTAFGFKRTDNLIAMVMLTCSDFDIALPGR